MGEVMPKNPIKLHIIAPKNPSINTHMHTDKHTHTHFFDNFYWSLHFFDNTVTSMMPTNETEVHYKYVVSI